MICEGGSNVTVITGLRSIVVTWWLFWKCLEPCYLNVINLWLKEIYRYLIQNSRVVTCPPLANIAGAHISKTRANWQFKTIFWIHRPNISEGWLLSPQTEILCWPVSNNTTILCIWAWERFRPSLWKWLQKRMKKKVLNWCSIFHWQKARNNARPPETAKIWWKAILSALHPTFRCFY